jgi:hypothetical protein
MPSKVGATLGCGSPWRSTRSLSLISVALAVVIEFSRSGSLLTQHHRVLRIWLVLLLCLDILLLVLLGLLHLRGLRIAGHAVDHEILLTPCLSGSGRKVLAGSWQEPVTYAMHGEEVARPGGFRLQLLA